jgi:hypothetical protein
MNREREREKLAYRYTAALEQGDLHVVAAILAAAEQDPVLDRMLEEINGVYRAELGPPLAHDVARVQTLIAERLPSGLPEDEPAAGLPPVTVADVLARLREDPGLPAVIRQELRILPESPEPQLSVPADLTQRGVRQLFDRLGLRLSSRLQERFRETAIFLTLGRTQGQARLAAARQARARRIPKPPEDAS